LDLSYGPRERNRVDFLKAQAGDGPTLLFIHGGYWQTRSKDAFTFCAAGPLAQGMNVALIGYTLAPEASLDEMAAEIHAGLDFLTRKLPEFGADPSRMIVAGWSAGAHLAAMALDHTAARAALLISGLYDLEPLRHTYVNDKLGLDEEAARRNSPVLKRAGANILVAVVAGSAELPLMRKQSADYAASRALQGLPVAYEEIPGANHFTILEELASPKGRLTALVSRLL
jgi:acetyl esterase/lipase